MKQTLLLVLLTLGFQLMGQNITGTVIDDSQQPVQYASVTAKTLIDDKLITGILTDEFGKFSIAVNDESIYLTIEFVGFQSTRIDHIKENLGTIILKSDTELEEVVVLAQKNIVEQKADRLVFNVENSTAAAGGDAIDALKVTPGITVNDDNISMIGKGMVHVMVNDRIQQMRGEELIAYLESIPADEIEKIEVITAPPAKYDAEGNSGLVNIQLKKPKEGSWNNQVRAGYTQTTYPAVTYGDTFTYSDGKLSLSAAFSGKQGHEGQQLTFDVDYPNGPWVGNTKFKNDEGYTYTRLSFDYDLAQNTTIGGMYEGNFRDINEADWGENIIYNNAGQNIGKVVSDGESSLTKAQHSANLHIVQKIDTLGRVISLDADYFSFNQPQDRFFSSERFGGVNSLFVARNLNEQGIDNRSVKLDMVHPIKNTQFSYGAKYSTTETNSFVQFYDRATGVDILDPSQSNEFMYEEKVIAAYADASRNLGEKWQVKAGLRAEQTETKGNSLTLSQVNENEYSNWFPTVYVSHNINDDNSANFNYSKRISRPDFWALNPFRWYVNQNSYAEGNPFLQPELSNNFELQHVYKGQLISKIYLSSTESSFGEVSTVNAEENQLIINRENFYNGTSYGIQETLVVSPTKKWNSTSQLGIYRTDGKLKEGFSNIELREGTSLAFFTNNSYVLAEKHSLIAEMTTSYASPQYIYMFETGHVFNTNLGLKASFSQDKLDVAASVNDLFKSSAPDVYATSNGITQKFNNYRDNRFFKVNFKYNFGNQKIRVKRRDFGNSDVKDRS